MLKSRVLTERISTLFSEFLRYHSDVFTVEKIICTIIMGQAYFSECIEM